MGPAATMTDTDPETERYRLYRAVGGLLAEAGSARPTVVVLDDLHYADRSTLQLTRFLAGEAISGLLILAVYRPSQLDTDSPLHDLRAEQVRAGRFVALDLDGLDADGRHLAHRGAARSTARGRQPAGRPAPSPARPTGTRSS